MSQNLFIAQLQHTVATTSTLKAAGNYAINEFEFQAIDISALAGGQCNVNFSFTPGIAIFTPIAFPGAAGIFALGISGIYRRSFPSPFVLQRNTAIQIISSGFTNCNSIIFNISASGFILP